MAWFKLDDAMWSHPKFLRLSDRAFRLWVRAGAYCAQHLTEGLITEDTLALLGASRKHCDELWSAGLWERAPDGGYRFHDWDHYQPSRRQIEERRRADRERMADWRHARKVKQLQSQDEPPEDVTP